VVPTHSGIDSADPAAGSRDEAPPMSPMETGAVRTVRKEDAMTQTHDVAVLVGSLRADGFSSRLARALMELAPDRLKLRRVEIGELPLYNQDLDETPPRAWQDFRDAVRPAHAVLFVTPEYNRSVPAPMKNAIDVGSRPYGKSVFDRKPAAVASQSPGAMGGFGANHAIRQSLVFLNMPVLQQPEVYFARAGDQFDDKGELTNEDTKKFLATFMQAFADLIDLHAGVRAVAT
jgi:chromate reductase